jgi:hypothetical protein
VFCFTNLFLCVFNFIMAGNAFNWAMIVLSIGGSAYVSIADEVKFWCVVLNS